MTFAGPRPHLLGLPALWACRNPSGGARLAQIAVHPANVGLGIFPCTSIHYLIWPSPLFSSAPRLKRRETRPSPGCRDRAPNSANCGSTTAPCRTFQYAHDNILGSGGGDIAVRDPGVYGQLVITKPLAIVNDGVGAAGMGAPAGGTAITINAGPNDTILLRGLTLDGGGTATTGIAFNSGGRIDIQKSVVRNFKQDGIDLLSPQFSYSITDTVVTGASAVGITVFPTVSGPAPSPQGVLRNVSVTQNKNAGINAFGTDMTIIDSNISNNGFAGVQTSCFSSNYCPTNTNYVYILNSVLNYNYSGANIGTNIVLSKTTIQKNKFDITNMAISSSPKRAIAAATFVYSYGDNDINFNDASGGVPLTPVSKQ